MKNRKIIIFISIIVVIVIGIVIFISSGNKEAVYQKISAQEAKEIIDEKDDIIILDVRTLAEFNNGHIEGAICLPNEAITNQTLEQLPDKKQEILIYCRSGNRSEQAARKLLKLGYQNVKDFGGIIDWPYEIAN